jgi:uncharacterized protein
MLVKIHKGTRMIVAICDSDLFGKKFEEGNKQLDLTTGFFEGDEMTVEEVKEVVRDCSMEDACFNVVGKESVGICKELGLIKEEGVIEIDGVPLGLILL